jgi:hypothetical protein
MGQLALQPVEGFLLRPLFVTPDQVTDVLADVLLGPVIAYVSRHELTQGSTKADSHRGRSGHGAAPLSFCVFNITKNAHKTSRRSPCFQPLKPPSVVSVLDNVAARKRKHNIEHSIRMPHEGDKIITDRPPLA